MAPALQGIFPELPDWRIIPQKLGHSHGPHTCPLKAGDGPYVNLPSPGIFWVRAKQEKSMYDFTREEIDLERMRDRIKMMTDDQLVAYGQSAAWMAEHSSGTTWKVRLEEARAEWLRRFKKSLEGQPGVDNDANS